MEESDILLDIVIEMNKKNLNPLYCFNKKRDIDIRDENGNTLLHIASAMGLQTAIEILFNFSPNIEARNCFGWTPIMQASRLGHKDIVEMLIDFGADVRATNWFGMRSIDLAAASGNVELVEYLGIFEVRVSNNISRDIEPLHIASLFGYYELVESLLLKEYDLSKIFTMKGISPLMCAAASGDITTVELFVVKAIRTSILNAMTENGTYDQVLLRNVICGYMHCDGISAQEVASSLNNKIVRKFLDMICQQLCSEDGFISCCIKSVLQVEFDKRQFIQRNLESAQVPLSLGITPLMLAALFDFSDIVDLLLSYKVDVNCADNVKGWTPFIYSVFHRNSEVAWRLYECGANIHARAFDGVSAFDFLQKLNDERIVNIFYQETQVGNGRKSSKIDDVSGLRHEDDAFEIFGNLHLNDRSRTSYPPMSVRRKATDRFRERRGSSAPFIMSSVPGMTPPTALQHHNGNYFSKEMKKGFGDWSGRSGPSFSYSCDKNDETEICCISPRVHVIDTDTRGFPGTNIDSCFNYGNERTRAVRKDHSVPDISSIDLMKDNKRRMSVPVSYESLQRSSVKSYISPRAFTTENASPTTIESIAKNFQMHPESFTLEKMNHYMAKLGYRRLSQESLENIKKADKENEYTLIKK